MGGDTNGRKRKLERFYVRLIKEDWTEGSVSHREVDID